MAVMKINFGSISIIRKENTHRWKEAYITAHNINNTGIKNELNRCVLDFKRNNNYET